MKERVYAAYAMNTLDFRSSRLQTGVRLEVTQSSFTGYHVTLDSARRVDAAGHRELELHERPAERAVSLRVRRPSATVGGIEMSWQEHLSFLPGAWRSLGARANHSFTTSKASVPGRSDNPALLRQAPNNWNLDATYDRGGLSARIGVTHNDANIYSYVGSPQYPIQREFYNRTVSIGIRLTP